MTPFTKNILFTTMAFLLIAVALFTTILKEYYFQAFPAVLLLVVGVTVGIHRLLLKKANEPNKFFTTFMAATGGKLMIYLFTALIYLFFDKENALAFVLSLLVLYFVYTFVEVKFLLKELKQHEANKL